MAVTFLGTLNLLEEGFKKVVIIILGNLQGINREEILNLLEKTLN